MPGRWAGAKLRDGLVVLRGLPPPTDNRAAIMSVNTQFQQAVEMLGIPLPVYLLSLDGRVADVQKHWKSLDFRRGDVSG